MLKQVVKKEKMLKQVVKKEKMLKQVVKCGKIVKTQFIGTLRAKFADLRISTSRTRVCKGPPPK